MILRLVESRVFSALEAIGGWRLANGAAAASAECVNVRPVVAMLRKQVS